MSPADTFPNATHNTTTHTRTAHTPTKHAKREPVQLPILSGWLCHDSIGPSGTERRNPLHAGVWQSGTGSVATVWHWSLAIRAFQARRANSLHNYEKHAAQTDSPPTHTTHNQPTTPARPCARRARQHARATRHNNTRTLHAHPSPPHQDSRMTECAGELFPGDVAGQPSLPNDSRIKCGACCKRLMLSLTDKETNNSRVCHRAVSQCCLGAFALLAAREDCPSSRLAEAVYLFA